MIRSQTQIVSQPSAILDLHFCPLEGLENILAVVSSTGSLAIFELDPSEDESSPLKHIATSSPTDIPEGVLFLSVAWHPSDAKHLAVTLSTGEVRLLRLNEDWKIEGDRDESVLSHSLEAWTVAFSLQMVECNGAASELTIYSGGDDSALRYASLGSAQTLEHEEPGLRTLYPPLKLDGHGAGVTAILPTTCRLADGSDVVITGSYDDCVRVFAIKAPQAVFGARKTQQLTEMNLGGGVWRLKLVHATESSGRWEGTILASCMHAGARVIRITGSLEGSEWHVSVLARFEEHQSMNYGSEVVPGSAGDTLTCLSTSFYDRLLCMWEAPLS